MPTAISGDRFQTASSVAAMKQDEPAADDDAAVERARQQALQQIRHSLASHHIGISQPLQLQPSSIVLPHLDVRRQPPQQQRRIIGGAGNGAGAADSREFSRARNGCHVRTGTDGKSSQLNSVNNDIHHHHHASAALRSPLSAYNSSSSKKPNGPTTSTPKWSVCPSCCASSNESLLDGIDDRLPCGVTILAPPARVAGRKQPSEYRQQQPQLHRPRSSPAAYGGSGGDRQPSTGGNQPCPVRRRLAPVADDDDDGRPRCRHDGRRTTSAVVGERHAAASDVYGGDDHDGRQQSRRNLPTPVKACTARQPAIVTLTVHSREIERPAPQMASSPPSRPASTTTCKSPLPTPTSLRRSQTAAAAPVCRSNGTGCCCSPDVDRAARRLSLSSQSTSTRSRTPPDVRGSAADGRRSGLDPDGDRLLGTIPGSNGGGSGSEDDAAGYGLLMDGVLVRPRSADAPPPPQYPWFLRPSCSCDECLQAAAVTLTAGRAIADDGRASAFCLDSTVDAFPYDDDVRLSDLRWSLTAGQQEQLAADGLRLLASRRDVPHDRMSDAECVDHWDGTSRCSSCCCSDGSSDYCSNVPLVDELNGGGGRDDVERLSIGLRQPPGYPADRQGGASVHQAIQTVDGGGSQAPPQFRPTSTSFAAVEVARPEPRRPTDDRQRSNADDARTAGAETVDDCEQPAAAAPPPTPPQPRRSTMYYPPQAFKFYVAQHVENVVKAYRERLRHRAQLEDEMDRLRLDEDARVQMRRMLSQKESYHNRLKRTRMSRSAFRPIAVLGRGAFGDVTLVRKSDTGALFAMKKLRKSEVLRRRQAAHVKAERDILAEADNEWIVRLYYSFQDAAHLYFVMEYIPGGDLMGLLIRLGVFDEELSRFYVAELVLAIDSVHRMGFIHRDIKPDNVLIDRHGHIKLTDFGLCTGFHWTHDSSFYHQQLGDGPDTGRNSYTRRADNNSELSSPTAGGKHHTRRVARSLVGTPNYIAPEVLSQAGYTSCCDWWSVGVILFEMRVGQPPFLANSPHETQVKVMNWQSTLRIPDVNQLRPSTHDLIAKLLCDQEHRLGRNGADELKRHPYFADVTFEDIRQRPAPYAPHVDHPTDISNFDAAAPIVTQSPQSATVDDDCADETGNHAFLEFTFRRFFDDDDGRMYAPNCGVHSLYL